MTTPATPLRPIESLWTVADVAAFLKASRRWVYQRVESGELPHLKLGGLIRFDPEAVRAFVLGAPVPCARVVPIRSGV